MPELPRMRGWSELEIETLREAYESGMTGQEMADLLGRPITSVRNQLHRLRYPGSCRDRCAKQYRSYQKSTTGAPRKGAAWTDRDDQIILLNPQMTARELAEQLGRTYAAIINRRHVLRSDDVR